MAKNIMVLHCSVNRFYEKTKIGAIVVADSLVFTFNNCEINKNAL